MRLLLAILRLVKAFEWCFFSIILTFGHKEYQFLFLLTVDAAPHETNPFIETKMENNEEKIEEGITKRRRRKRSR